MEPNNPIRKYDRRNICPKHSSRGNGGGPSPERFAVFRKLTLEMTASIRIAVSISHKHHGTGNKYILGGRAILKGLDKSRRFDYVGFEERHILCMYLKMETVLLSCITNTIYGDVRSASYHATDLGVRILTLRKSK